MDANAGEVEDSHAWFVACQNGQHALPKAAAIFGYKAVGEMVVVVDCEVWKLKINSTHTHTRTHARTHARTHTQEREKDHKYKSRSLFTTHTLVTLTIGNNTRDINSTKGVQFC